jgi:hypothetical protein
MRGTLWNGDPYIDPNTSQETIFPLAGDPVTGTGWYEGTGWPGGPVPGDRRSLISSGPFTMQPADTQEVVVAIYMARGSDNLNSVTELKNTAQSLRDFYYTGTITSLENNEMEIVRDFKLYQNYPNPFNPSTKIKYSVPQASNVVIKVFDILGNEIETLVDEYKNAGRYEIDFNASNLPSGVSGKGGYTSGVYFYQLRTDGLVVTKKMILMK